MWRKSKLHINLVDSEIVRDGFLFFDSITNQFDLRNESIGGEQFSKRISVPILQFMKVHKGHPLKVLSAGMNHVNVYPANPDTRRMPAEVYKDKLDYDCTTLILFPYDIVAPLQSPKYSIETIPDGFLSKDGKISNGSLYYCPHGIEVDGRAGTFSRITPSQVSAHLWYWLTRMHEISTFNEERQEFISEGTLSAPMNTTSRDKFHTLVKRLEGRYKTRLDFVRPDF